MAKWDLQFFYSSLQDESIQQDLQKSLHQAKEIRNVFYQKISSPSFSENDLKEFFDLYEVALKPGYTAYQYASLCFAEATSDAETQKLYAVVMDYITKIDMELSFWKPVLLMHSSDTLQTLMQASSLQDYQHVLAKLIQAREHILSEETEKTISAFENSSIRAFGNLYEKITNAYEFSLDENGPPKTGPEIRALRTNPNPQIRRDAMKVFFTRYQADKMILEHTYNSIVKHYDTEAKLRHFPEPISMRNQANEVEDATIKTVLEVTTSRTPMVQRYYRWKSSKMGIEPTLADIYAPLSPVTKEYTFAEAKDLVLRSYYNFDTEMGEIAESFFTENRIDAEPKKGKRGGAFCSYVLPNYKPFVLMNFTGNMRDVMTLAHEIGHGIHGTLSSVQRMWNYHTPLTMAEVASVFGEMLVMDTLLPTLTKEDKTAFLASKTEDMFATMFRQNMFARFEISAHQTIQEKGSANWDELSELYHQELKKMFGDVVQIPQEFHFEWASIPHIFNVPFYVYAYNFANLLVIALYELYGKEGAAFVPKYKNLLRSGGKHSPEKLLQLLNINLKERSFWERGFDFVDQKFVTQLEKTQE